MRFLNFVSLMAPRTLSLRFHHGDFDGAVDFVSFLKFEFAFSQVCEFDGALNFEFTLV